MEEIEKKEPAKKTESQVEDPWEDEVQDQLGNKIDDVLDQIRKEPLPQPTPSKRRKTRGKKKFDRKVLSSESMGLSEQLSEIKINVMETREALYNMYKIDKARFEFNIKSSNEFRILSPYRAKPSTPAHQHLG